MSGLCGVVRWDGGEVEPSWVEAMVEATRWRGRGGVGRHVAGGVGVAHLSGPGAAGEPQPLVRGELVVVADARIDNRAELIGLLEPAGGGEATEAELILAAYRRWGRECAARLVGDFAFVVWDGAERRLYGARDALGMRSLVYRSEPGRVLFATEVKQILAVPGVPARIFEPAVGVWLVGPHVPSDWTFWEGVERLAPGHAAEWEVGRTRTWRYWEAEAGRRIRYRREEEYAEHLLELLRASVGARLRGAGRVGLLLSGGVDSGSVAAVGGALLREGAVGGAELRAYSFAFEELRECDERAVSGPLAAHWGIPVTDVPADGRWPLRGWPEHGPDRDDPYLFVYQPLLDACLERARAEGCSLVLSGDRGDEVTGDWIYDPAGLLLSGRLGALASELRQIARERRSGLVAAARRELLPALVTALRRRMPGARAAPSDADADPGGRRPGGAPSSPERAPPMPPWIRPEFADRIDLAGLLAGSRAPSARDASPRVRRLRRIRNRAATHRAIAAERRWTAAGVEYGDPWSDRPLVEFVAAIPQHFVNRATGRKRIVRKAVAGLLPPFLAGRLGKTEPVELFHRGFAERGRTAVEALLTEPEMAARGWVDAGALRRAYAAYVETGRTPHDFWWPLTLEWWLRTGR